MSKNESMSDEQKYYISGEFDDVNPIFTAGLSFRQDVLALASGKECPKAMRAAAQGSVDFKPTVGLSE